MSWLGRKSQSAFFLFKINRMILVYGDDFCSLFLLEASFFRFLISSNRLTEDLGSHNSAFLNRLSTAGAYSILH